MKVISSHYSSSGSLSHYPSVSISPEPSSAPPTASHFPPQYHVHMPAPAANVQTSPDVTPASLINFRASSALPSLSSSPQVRGVHSSLVFLNLGFLYFSSKEFLPRIKTLMFIKLLIHKFNSKIFENLRKMPKNKKRSRLVLIYLIYIIVR